MPFEHELQGADLETRFISLVLAKSHG